MIQVNAVFVSRAHIRGKRMCKLIDPNARRDIELQPLTSKVGPGHGWGGTEQIILLMG